MKKKLLYVLVGATLFFSNETTAQYLPGFSQLITVTENAGSNQMDFQARLVIDTQTEVAAGNMELDGSDIRFMTENPCDSLNVFQHWIESGMNTSTTIIWVKLPMLQANTTDSIYMYYGDATAIDISNFTLTFPSAIVSGGMNVMLSGSNNVGWLQIDAGDTLFLAAGSILDIQSRNAIIDGVVYGLGAGYASPGIGILTGNGPGGGFGGSSSGAGGGSYAGIGGAGGYDSGDPINTGGAIYGTLSGTDLDMGSTGGSVNSVAAGSGGGAFMLTSEFVVITGDINVNGGEAQQPGGGQGAGGGAGGGVLVLADNLYFSGNISANGGNGSVGTSTANDDGGGGGGGRVKLFYDNTSNLTGSYLVNGGVGGPNGTALGGQTGLIGTTFEGVLTFDESTYVYGVVNNSSPTPVLTSLQDENGVCGLTPVAPLATDICGNVITGVPDVLFPVTATGTTLVTWTYTASNGISSTQTQNVIINAINVATHMANDTITIVADNLGATYQWIDCNTNQPIAGETNDSYTPTFGSNFAVIITENGCSDTSACVSSNVGIAEIGIKTLVLYPNPTSGMLSISFEGEIKNIEVVDILGRVVSSPVSIGNKSVNATDLTSGKYMIRIITDNDQVLVEEFVVQK